MSVYILTIDAVERELRLGSLSWQSVVIGRTVMSCAIVSEAGAYRPALNALVELTEDGDTIFVGRIRQTEEHGVDGQPIDTIETRITCDSLAVLAERRYIDTMTIAAGSTLKSALQQVDTDAYLADFGLSLDAAQVTGPTLDDEIVADGWQLAELFKRLSTLTGYVPEYDATEWRFYDPSARSAPINIIDGDGHHVGDISVERTRDKYVNRVIARGGQPPNRPTTDTFAGDGVTSTFTLTYPIAGPFPYLADSVVGNAVVAIDGFTESIGGLSAVDLLWTYDPDTLIITRLSGPPDNGAVITIEYDVSYPITVIVEDASEIGLVGPFESVLTYPDVYDKALLTALAEQELSDGLDTITRVDLSSHEPGLLAGQTLTITAADRDIDGTFLITEVSARTLPSTEIIRRTIKAIEGDRFKGSFRDLIIAWLGGGTRVATSSSSGPAVAGTGGVPGQPDKSVQFNRSGSFGGDAGLLYDDGNQAVNIAGNRFTSSVRGTNTGDTYGVETAAAVAAFGIDENAGGVNLALFNQAATLAEAFTIFQDDDATVYFETDNGDIAIISYGGQISLSAGTDIVIDPGTAKYSDLRSLTKMRGWMPWAHRQTSTYTIDVANTFYTVHYFDPTSSNFTATLPLLSATNVWASPHGRIFCLKHIGTAGIVTIAPSGSDVISDGTGTNTSIKLLPGQAVWIQAWNSTNARWHVINEMGRAVMTATISVTDAQIKAWPTTAITLVGAKGTGILIDPLRIDVLINATGGAYTNVDGDASVKPLINSVQVGSSIPNDSANSLTELTDLLANAGQRRFTVTGPYQDDRGSSASWGLLSRVATTSNLTNQALTLSCDNNGAGNFTGGNASNNGTIIVTYRLVAAP